MAETDVLVVGAGPTGLMLACELALAGIRVRVLELLDTIGGLEPAIRPWADRTTLVASNPAVDPGVYRKERVPGVVLVRPDGYVAWAADRGSDLEAEVGSALAHWCGAGASRHNRIADAAIGVLAETGARGLTHRAVDAAAGEPTGTTSRYFRTREALMRGIVDRSLESLTTAMREFAEAQRPRDVEGLVEILVQAVLGAVTVERTRSTAMCELFLESRHRDPRRRQVYPLLMTTKVKERPRRPGKISGKNQITLPVAALADAHLGPGDEVLVEAVRDGELRIVRQRDPLDDLIGSAPGLSAATDVETLRDEWQR